RLSRNCRARAKVLTECETRHSGMWSGVGRRHSARYAEPQNSASISTPSERREEFLIVSLSYHDKIPSRLLRDSCFVFGGSRGGRPRRRGGTASGDGGSGVLGRLRRRRELERGRQRVRARDGELRRESGSGRAS